MRHLLPLSLCFVFASPSSLAQNAADEIFGADAMAAVREKLHRSHGAAWYSKLDIERLEWQADDDDNEGLLDMQAWLGSDHHKLWFKTETELNDDGTEAAELQALYSRAIHPFWDLQVGLRHDLKPEPARNYWVFGLQGTAPYWFEIDTALFVSNQGDASVQVEAEYDLRLSQRWILQPRAELLAAFSDDAEIGLGSGLSTVEAGLRLRYQLRPEFVPYWGLSWSKAFGDTASFSAEESSTTSLVIGLSFWY